MCTELWCTKNSRFISFSPSYVVGNRKWKQMLKLVDWSNKKLTPSLVPFCLSFYWSDSFPTLPHALKYLQKLLLDVDLRDMKGFFFLPKALLKPQRRSDCGGGDGAWTLWLGTWQTLGVCYGWQSESKRPFTRSATLITGRWRCSSKK